MEKKELKPFHESCIDSLNLLEQEIVANPEFKNHPDLFIIRFEIEFHTILSQVNRTIIPEEYLQRTIKKIEDFFQGFKERYQDIIESAVFLAGSDEDKIIEEYFSWTIENLKERMSEGEKYRLIMNSAGSLEEAIKLAFEHMPLGTNFLGPKGLVTLARNSIPKGDSAKFAEVQAINMDGNYVMFTAGYRDGEEYQLVCLPWHKIEAWSNKW